MSCVSALRNKLILETQDIVSLKNFFRLLRFFVTINSRQCIFHIHILHRVKYVKFKNESYTARLMISVIQKQLRWTSKLTYGQINV
jgi:hypothetical protein